MRAFFVTVCLVAAASCQGNIVFEDSASPPSTSSSSGAVEASVTAASSNEAVGEGGAGSFGMVTASDGSVGLTASSTSGTIDMGIGGASGSGVSAASMGGAGGSSIGGAGGIPGGGTGATNSASSGSGILASGPGGASSASCADQVKDGDETDVDCGGGTCPRCGLTQICTLDADCASNACDATSSGCVPSQCIDHRQDGDETDIDCGGPGVCLRCTATQKCKVASDCTTGICDALSQTCGLNQCADHQQDGTETDIDCGGGDSCLRCKPGKQCNGAVDCVAGHTCSTTTPHVCL